ncbi:MAG TPA: rhombosortase [Steroidobacteraceae bacterium]|nr:rhombosortase [Steroidobacteraceae bacterium]
MNAEAPPRGLGGFLKSLNADRAYGWALLGVCALLGIIELAGEPLRAAWSYQRTAIGAGEWWRVITAHFVHLDANHALLNTFGLVLMWALFARDYSPLRWVAIYLVSSLTISFGLYVFDPHVEWYVGASGALHGVMTAGTLAHLRRRDLDGWILAAFILAKLSYEQIAGSMPFAGSANTLVDAHLYGAIGGLALALFLRSRAEPP